MGPVESLKYFIPELVLLGGAFFVFLTDFFVKNKKVVKNLALLTLTLALCFCKEPSQPLDLFYGFFHLDAFANVFRFFALIAVAVTLLLTYSYSHLRIRYEGELYGLFLFIAFGLILIGAANNLLMIFLAVEFVSLISYLLVGFLKENIKAKESAIKYLLFGSVCSGIMLYGMSLLYGVSGSLDLSVIGAALNPASLKPLALVATLCFFAGLGFKVSMAPFHMWAPDVYEGAPTPITAFLTVAPKALGFAVLMRVLSTVFGAFYAEWTLVLTALSILTMTIGNLGAISQTNMKRFLAYSSIAQAGYILMGLAVFSQLGKEAVLIYLLAYIFTNLGAFAVAVFVEERTGSEDLASYAGLSKRSPAAAALLTIFLLSLTGIPPLAGFIGKYYVFAAAIEARFITLAVAAAINSAVAAYYYFRVIRLMYLTPATEPSLARPSFSSQAAIWLMFTGVMAVGVFPAFFIKLLFG